MKYIPSKITKWKESGQEPEYESLSIENFAQEFDYATRYLSRFLKVRPFVMYLLLFKRAFLRKAKEQSV